MAHHYIRKHLLLKLGIFDIPQEKLNIENLKRTEWSDTFEQLMRNRLVVGAFRYGTFHAPNKSKFNNIQSIIERAKLYKKDHNTEHLVDIANLALCEFVEPSYQDCHFKSKDDGIHKLEIT